MNTRASVIHKGLQAKLRSVLQQRIRHHCRGVPLPKGLWFRVEDETIRFRVTPMCGNQMVSRFWSLIPDDAELPGEIVMGYWLVEKREFINWVFSGKEGKKWIKLWKVEEWL